MRVNKKRLLIIAAVIIALAAVLFRLLPEAGFPQGETAVHIDFESDVSYQVFAYQKNILLVSGEGIRAYNTSGQEAWRAQEGNTTPFIDIAGKYLLVGETAGKSFSLYSGNKLLRSCKLENNLISAKLNESGYTILFSEEAGYKGMATVQNLKGNEIFRWHSGEGYIIDADLSDDNRYLAVSQLMTNKEKAYSRILFFDIEKNEQIAVTECEDSVAAKLDYSGGGWIAVSESGLMGFNKTGKQKYNVSFQGRTIVSMDVSNPNNLVFAFTNSQNNTVLEMYDKNGNQRGTYSASGELKNLSVAGEVILCSQLRTLLYIDPSGRMRKSENISHDIKNIQLFNDRKHVLVMGGNNANILKIR